MSNQVARNVQSGNRYAPNNAERDTLTLIKNVAAVGAQAAFGWQSKTIDNAGVGLFFNRLNGNDTAINGTTGVVNYPLYQNPSTMPFYVISANSNLSGGTTLIFSKVDNVLSINCVIPSVLEGAVADPPDKIDMSIRVFNRDGTIAGNYAGFEREYEAGGSSVPTWTTPNILSSISAVIRVSAGQSVGIYVGTNQATAALTKTFIYQDKLRTVVPGANVVSYECFLDIQKI